MSRTIHWYFCSKSDGLVEQGPVDIETVFIYLFQKQVAHKVTSKNGPCLGGTTKALQYLCQVLCGAVAQSFKKEAAPVQAGIFWVIGSHCF